MNTDAPLTGGTCLAILPVVFEGVAIVETEQECGIKWTNLTESDILYYVIEQSDNAVNYYEITKVQPLRNDGGKADYLFSHKKYPDKEAAWKLCLELKENGLLAKPTHGDKIRLAPPLLISKPQVEECIDLISKSLDKLVNLPAGHRQP